MKTPILDQLNQLPDSHLIPMHMPGHKRKAGSFFDTVSQYDITEIRGYDNLHDPQGIILESMEELSKVYGSKHTWPLINGSSCGLHAAILAVCRPGDHILIGRNCHKAVYHIIEMLQLKVHYLMPEISSTYHISLGMGENAIMDMRKIIDSYDIKALVITSPTYEGIVSDIEAFHNILKEKKIPLIVDEAHGAHFVFHDAFPKSAIHRGADLVIQSSHKTLPSMTQTAMLHLCSDLVSKESVSKALSYIESSSPSYILMASIEYGVHYMINHEDKTQQYVDNLAYLYTICGQLKHISLLDAQNVEEFEKDLGKIVILLPEGKMNGQELFDLLYEKHGIELEMAELSYAIAMTSVMDCKEDYERLYASLKDIDDFIEKEKIYKEKTINLSIEDFYQKRKIPEKIMEAWECDDTSKELLPLWESQDRISASYVHLYPPGVPILIPGEKIMKETIENINYYLYNGYCVTGITEEKILVCKEEI